MSDTEDFYLTKDRMALNVRKRDETHDAEFPIEDLILTGKDVKDFKFVMKEGGTVTLKFRVVLGQLEEDSLLKLLRIDNQTVPISLWQAAMEEEQDNFQQVMDLGSAPEQQSDARKAAEAAFKNPAGAQSPEELIGLEVSDPPEQ